MENTETLTITKQGDSYSIVVQHDQSGSAYGVDLSKDAYHQLCDQLLNKYSEFLENQGYTDSDWRDEKPTAIERFLKQL